MQQVQLYFINFGCYFGSCSVFNITEKSAAIMKFCWPGSCQIGQFADILETTDVGLSELLARWQLKFVEIKL